MQGTGVPCIRVSKNRQTAKMQATVFGWRWRATAFRQQALRAPRCRGLALQGILTYCANRVLPYSMYADGRGLLVFGAPLTSASLSKNTFLTD